MAARGCGHVGESQSQNRLSTDPDETQSKPGAPSRDQAISLLKQLKAHYEDLQEENWSPGALDTQYDFAVLPALVAAENARTPNLNLQLLSPQQDFAEWLQKERSEHARAIVTLPGLGIHRLVADVRRIGGKTSVLMIEPLSLKEMTRIYWEEETLPALGEAFGSNVTVSVLCLDTQKSATLCQIFALSAASKMADNEDLINSLHQRNLSGKPFETALGKKAEILAVDEKNKNIRVLDGKGILPPRFMKHSNSRTTINHAIEANPPAYAQALVNKPNEKEQRKAQTLTERFDSHIETRYEKPVSIRYKKNAFPNSPEIEDLIEATIKPRSFSVSVEKKNLIYLDRAITYLKKAPDAECAKVLAQMEAFEFEKVSEGPDDFHYAERDWGPHPNQVNNFGNPVTVNGVAMEPRAPERRPSLASLLMKERESSSPRAVGTAQDPVDK